VISALPVISAAGIVILAAGIAIAFIILLQRKMPEVSRWKINFWVVTIMFVAFLALGIWSLILANSMGESGWGFLGLGFISLFLAIISLPIVIVFGIKAFRQRTKEEVERVYDKGTQSTNKHMEKTSIGLAENVAGLLCYVLGWFSGLVFILIEQRSKFVRFHAMQSIIVFGVVTIAGLALGWIPIIGHFLDLIISLLGGALWIVLMLKASQGTRYKLPWAGNLAEKYE